MQVLDLLLPPPAPAAVGQARSSAPPALRASGRHRIDATNSSRPMPAWWSVTRCSWQAERLAARGYNQAELIGRGLLRRFGLPLSAVLVRTRPMTKLHRLKRVARLNNLRGAFAVATRPPPAVILVDDIITTTATLEACASVLRDAGCETVYSFAVAREV
ncbi:MAG: ComF family protein [Candidatus Limnocylindria bacterium]